MPMNGWMTTTTERPTVLVADDSVFARRWAERLLTDAGHAVTSVAGGREAYALARASSPDVLVVEEAIAGLSGRELLRALRAGRDEMGVVLLTASADPEARGRRPAPRRRPLPAQALQRGRPRRRPSPGRREAGAARRARRSREARNAGEVRAAADVQEALLPPPAALPGGLGARHRLRARPRRRGRRLRRPAARPAPPRRRRGRRQRQGGRRRAARRHVPDRRPRRPSCRGDSPAEALGAAGALLFDGLTRAGRFLTAVVAEIDLATGRLTYADAGHGHHLLLAPGGAERVCRSAARRSGSCPARSTPTAREGLGPGERLAAFSDGLVEDGGAGDPAAARAELAARLAAGADPADLVRAAGRRRRPDPARGRARPRERRARARPGARRRRRADGGAGGPGHGGGRRSRGRLRLRALGGRGLRERRRALRVGEAAGGDPPRGRALQRRRLRPGRAVPARGRRPGARRRRPAAGGGSR